MIFAAHDRMLRLQINERFLVTCTSGDTWDGQLKDVDDEHLVLRSVKALQDGTWQPVDGEVWLPRLSISYMQRP